MINFFISNEFLHDGYLWGLLFFLLFGLIMGRIGAVLACMVQDESGQIKVSIIPFFFKCQKKWGNLPIFYIIRRIHDPSIPIRPLLMEFIMSFVFSALFYHIGWQYVLIEYLIFSFGIIVASFIDLEYMILPDFLTLSGMGIGLVGALLNPELGRGFWESLGGLVMGGGFLWLVAICYQALRNEDGIGGGDLKLLAWIGAVLTWRAIPVVILLSCFFGLLVAMVHAVLWRQNWWRKEIPFGPYLSASAIIYMLYGENLAHWYLSYFLLPQIVNP